jgi:D-alanyl-lipoteichoic acid acyltransferase DltB (MBOAT superfamily)
VAGPIVRASEFFATFHGWKPPSAEAIQRGCLLLILGLTKKMAFADPFAQVADAYFQDPAAHPGMLTAWSAVFAFAMQIFFDFSGYTDMAIGMARLFGFEFPVNFTRPYLAWSVTEFWRRWHITLSRWLRDYLYIPLGGNRGGPWRTYRNLMLTMLLGGLWHGASWNFVIWGGIHGGVLVAERLWRQHKPEHWPALPQWAGIILTFHIVTLAWIFFRSSTFEGAMQFLAGIGALDFSGSILRPMGLFLILLGTALHALPPDAIQQNAIRLRRINAAWVGLGMGVLILIIDAMRPAGVEPFIYYQF